MRQAGPGRGVVRLQPGLLRLQHLTELHQVGRDGERDDLFHHVLAAWLGVLAQLVQAAGLLLQLGSDPAQAVHQVGRDGKRDGDYLHLQLHLQLGPEREAQDSGGDPVPVSYAVGELLLNILSRNTYFQHIAVVFAEVPRQDGHQLDLVAFLVPSLP